ncbi:phage tail family protein [Blastococcus mobilis]|uniref:Phage tail protein n=1 Tax=Blastococcus mobilis TaxID=1938746 RepID=A0A238VG59_9ACTN|nr:phage tail family protein [Blastococcus mobilis]SNR33144.1 Phage tail protein [Blastococcus mobilis]
MGPTSILWGGLTLATGQDGPYRLTSLEGWEELPPARYDKQSRTNAHGAHPSRVFSDERLVIVEGFCWSATERDALLAQLQAATPFQDDEQPLTVTAAGRTLSASAQLLQARPMLLKGQWGIGRFGWLLQWRCPDPLRYGPPRTVATPLPAPGGGLQYNLYKTGFLDYGQPGTLGRVTLTNAGTAPAPILFGVRGGLEQGWEISAAGDRLRYVAPVPSGQVIEVDTAVGTVMVEGTASRRSSLVISDWLYVPRAAPDGTPGELTVQFTSLGGSRDPAAELSATSSDVYW